MTYTQYKVSDCAKLIRKELKEKFPNIKFRVTSKSYSMGDSVRIDYVDGVPICLLDKLLKKYEYGSFDSMTDYYDNNNVQDYPQTKYIIIQREISPELLEATIPVVAKYWDLKDTEDQTFCSVLGRSRYTAVLNYLDKKYFELNPS